MVPSPGSHEEVEHTLRGAMRGDVSDLDRERVRTGRKFRYTEAAIEEVIVPWSAAEVGLAALRKILPPDRLVPHIPNPHRACQARSVDAALGFAGEILQLDINLDERMGPKAVLGRERLVGAEFFDGPAKAHLADGQSAQGPQREHDAVQLSEQGRHFR